jgi:hypothetical protein
MQLIRSNVVELRDNPLGEASAKRKSVVPAGVIDSLGAKLLAVVVEIRTHSPSRDFFVLL